MTTFKGAIRSYTAAVRKAEREQQKRAREIAKQYKIQQQQREIADVSTAIRDYENYILFIKSIHKNASEKLDWYMVRQEPAPVKPLMTKDHEIAASQDLQRYKPSFFDKLFGTAIKKTKALESAVAAAKKKDAELFAENLKQYETDLTDWHALQRISNGISNRESSAFREALQFFKPFDEMDELGSRLTFSVTPDNIVVDLHVNGINIIPNYVLSQTARGKLSKKNMPIGKFNELYQDYVCSCALRIAREAFAYLPLNLVVVNASTQLLNTSTGREEEQTILATAINRDTLNKLRFEMLDPSDSMTNFITNMKFSKTNGFSPVSRIEASTLLQ
ncbi:hypothetical protein SAMN04488128_105518 [Chitinophaga eiseniae]|uniref:Uncharacterized protein n=1 Tax=Chitinophaga eiseniae TaxID=634771 RepID=A0A1T4TNP0_9BACT|nr:hypothetical protein [Chitinophaga eiseniae]SKA41799.1 hypothetical protein SAMN04488128_105518 [Chitinophaga eiseniae]